MPEIRKTGKYISNKNDMDEIKKLNKTIDNYKTELNYYDDKYKFKPSEHGYLYINQNNQTKDGQDINVIKLVTIKIWKNAFVNTKLVILNINY